MSGILQGVLASIGGAPAAYIEDVFSTWLYTGTSATQTITNGIDLSGKGGIVWTKSRSNTSNQYLVYSDGSSLNGLYPNLTNAAGPAGPPSGHVFNNNGFTIDGSSGLFNFSGYTYCSWTFREQAKFFDVVTYTGNGNSPQTISHSLGSVPGFVIIKRTDASENWQIAARRNDGFYELLNFTTAASQGFTTAGTLGLTSTSFDASAMVTTTNGATYVAYLFAHNAGGFGASGTDNVISCGSFTTDGSGNATVSLGYEPQYLLYKRTNGTSAWVVVDVMRGFDQSALTYLLPNTSGAEGTLSGNYLFPTATGFTFANGLLFTNSSYIYMAIRRGPMKTPTSGTEVFSPSAVNVAAGTAITTGFPIDWQINYYRSFAANYNSINATRLLGTSSTSTESGQVLWTSKADAQQSFGMTRSWDNTGFQQTSQLWPNINNIYWNFRRAPGFFDVVAYTGTGTTTTQTHNLGVVPELMIFKGRSLSINWFVYGNITASDFSRLILNQTGSGITYGYADGAGLTAQPTSSLLNLGSASATNGSGNTYVAYLFATLAGVSKVGSYTGTGSTQTINAGLPTGARFVLIKRTDDVGNWWVWDTARGMVAGTDPRLNLNTTDAEINNNWVYTVTNGFQIVTSDATVNASGGTYIYLAIA